MSEELSRQIIRRILADVGAVPNALGVGLMDKNLLLTKTLKIKYDGGPVEHDMYVGQISVNDSKLKGLLIDLTVDEVPEFMFVFRMDALPIHSAKVLYDHVDLGETYLMIYNAEKESWLEAGIYFKARLLADFERLTSMGFLWEDCRDYEDLYRAAVELINLQKG
jgi:hypothetical protein